MCGAMASDSNRMDTIWVKDDLSAQGDNIIV